VSERPFFSIIIPIYNREALVGRSLRSCLSQSFTDFEIVAVDDASTDSSIAAVEAFRDPCIRLLRHTVNRGRCPARNTGMAAARGQWFVFLDSDDELLPGALEMIQARAIAAPSDATALRFMCVDERGTSPDPPHDDRVIDYEDFLRMQDPWLHGRQEALPCSRASSFPAVRYSEGHAPESWYHLELVRHGRVVLCREIVRRYHHDAPQRVTRPVPRQSLRWAADEVDDLQRVLTTHGDALRRLAPSTYFLNTAAGATSAFLCGRRLLGVRLCVQLLRRGPFSPRTWFLLLVGLIGRHPLAAAQWLWNSVPRRSQ
jgi:glycosyltransferase involved in cell wall biosynthesis